MSFILDALKKLERQKQASGSSHQEEQAVMEGGRRWGEERRRGLFGWGSVIVAVAALVVAAVALYRVRPSNTPTAPMTATPPVNSPPVVGPSTSVPEDSSDAEVTPPTPEPEKAPATPVVTRQSQPPSSRVDGLPTTPAEVDEALEVEPLEEMETAHPVRLQGRTGTDRDEGNVSDDVADAPRSEIPEGLPELILQGTSVVEGKAVAVVNYQRLFEGDFIEGARVIRISDSLVELEFKGQRFKIRF